MITITTSDKAVTVNGVFTDNKGEFSFEVDGNKVLLRCKGFPQRFRAAFSDYRGDGQSFGTMEGLVAWLNDNLFYDGGGNGEGLQKATSAEAIAGTDDSKYVTSKAAHDAIAAAMAGDMAAYVNVITDAALAFADSGFYTFNGSTARTWVLPSVANNTGVHYFVSNAGSVNLTISGDLYFRGNVLSLTLAAGDSIIIQNNSVRWNVQ